MKINKKALLKVLCIVVPVVFIVSDCVILAVAPRDSQ